MNGINVNLWAMRSGLDDASLSVQHGMDYPC